MKLYISGPMSGKPAFNIPLFDEYAKVLRSAGHEVISPAELDDPEFRELCLNCPFGSIEELQILCEQTSIEPATWGDLLARDLKLLADDGIEGVCVLPGWEKSRGALLETFAARLCGLPIYEVAESGLLGQLRPIQAFIIRHAHAKCDGWLSGSNVNARKVVAQFVPLHECGITPTKTLKAPKLTQVPDGALPPLDTAESVQADQEVRVTSDTGGQKGAKDAVLGDICPKALMLVAKVAGFGRHKYSRLNYLQGFDWSLSYDALQRHLHEFWAGEDIDPESGLPHLAHAAWQCLCLLAFYIRKIGKDDRP